MGYVSAKGRPYFQICYLFLAVIRTIPIWAPLEQISRERKQPLVLSAALGEQPLRCPGCLFLSHGSPPTALPISLPQLLALPLSILGQASLLSKGHQDGGLHLLSLLPFSLASDTDNTPGALNGVLSLAISWS